MNITEQGECIYVSMYMRCATKFIQTKKNPFKKEPEDKLKRAKYYIYFTLFYTFFDLFFALASLPGHCILHHFYF